MLTAALAGSLLLPGLPVLAAPDEAVLTDAPYYNQPLAVAPQPAPGAAALYTVRTGDTLSAVAGRFGLTVDALCRANGLSGGDLILTGQVLTIPGGMTRHRVADGETLTGIARRFGVDTQELARVNNLTGAGRLAAGREMIIPVPNQAAAPAASRHKPAGWDMLPGWNAVAALPLHELARPVAGRVSSPFGMRADRPHEGVDIAADEGAPIRAVKAGRVIFAGPRGTYGNAVIIDHGNGLQTLYAHARQVLVQPGQAVNAGDVIALVGSTGRSTGPHLHMEVLLNGVRYDPLLCLQPAYA
ncbi:peptidoglycan DD-metalloendopeptidase family protein [Desulfotomaculum copahuensis]|uniref:LysM domain-containing protein n=1 Tax=Desulfotomaculum copahuensis TaxID=1838280 RepID=A0A1B7LBC5_9FIRM|nr:M23 family metallopeptidase [Desulfotomaculum copahuensis]OAT79832.1 hypothetical protein A6M21_15000 [Desulfotomaculum copahuensis]